MSATQITYDNAFYEKQMQGSYTSAQEILGYLNTLLPQPHSVIDVGCGVGTWLRVWQESYADISIYGIDGNNVDSHLYQIPLQSYQQVDLTQNAHTLIKNLSYKALNGGGG
ncbi:methyltransferase domain-containing protein [Helicobacter sp. MIT 21-1697]|uniref:methyltransferase domain-containing protein n=1 Tax=Helicobacter sp. MIT 21-1697 TaxID=2993733 RepID=UPI00224B8F18|nr:methyltransferase domain-containing protein [Helicobacter sp. MIT 21-1697]MCX2717623.1 methyltransferase domain-containing protein [Helicobacter sp. MIT 21-1697]